MAYAPRALKVLDLETKEVREFPSQIAYAASMGYSNTIVNQWIKDPLHRPICGRYLLKRLKDETPWREVTQEERDYYYKDFIVTRDPYNDEYREYSSSGSCAAALQIHRSVPYSRATSSRGQIVFKDGLQYKFKNDKTPWRIFTPLELQGLDWHRNGEVFLNGKKL